MKRDGGPGTSRRVPGSRSAILTGDFNMKPEDPTKLRLSDPFGSGVPALLDVWSASHQGEAHPPSFCLFDQTHGQPHCCDYVFATGDMVGRIERVAYDIETKVSDHQPVLVVFSDRSGS